MHLDISKLRIKCPHCAHHLFISLDTTAGDQDYYEACDACCNDVHLNMHIDEYQQKIQLTVDSDDEQIY